MIELAFLNGVADSMLLQIGILIVLATFFAYFARLTKQPLIPAYVIAGIILGPIGFGIIKDIKLIQAMSDIGIVFLLFLIGLEVDIKKLKDVGFVSAFSGILQVALTFILGYGAGLWLGFNSINAVYTGLILAFSSTLVVVKLLSDKDEVSTIHGRLMVGILLVQDIMVIFALSFLSGIESFSFMKILSVLVGAFLLVGIALITNRFFVHRLFRFAAKSDEFMFLLSISVCFIFVALANMFGFSIAIGAFIAGVMLANLPYHYNIMGRVQPLKDFFSTIFFVSLGMQIMILEVSKVLSPLAIFLAIVIIAKPILIMLLLSFFGYGKRTTFIAGIGLAQISEFALILIADGRNVITPELFSMTIILAVSTITFTSYILKYDERIYNAISPALSFLDRMTLKTQKLSYQAKGKGTTIILVGCHRMGSIILKRFYNSKDHIKVIDMNPDIIHNLIEKKISCIYGDITNMEVMKKVNYTHARFLISTLPSEEDNMKILSYAKEQNPKIKVILNAQHLHIALNLYEAGADYVIVPPIMSGERISLMLKGLCENKHDLTELKNVHLKHLLEMNAEQ